jgi:hypothetical protein
MKTDKTVAIVIHRKPTFTDAIIPSDSCHPQEHKHAAIHHMISRIQTYELNHETEKKRKTQSNTYSIKINLTWH